MTYFQALQVHQASTAVSELYLKCESVSAAAPAIPWTLTGASIKIHQCWYKPRYTKTRQEHAAVRKEKLTVRSRRRSLMPAPPTARRAPAEGDGGK